MSFKLKVASISDIHLGHRKTPTGHILNNLRRAFDNTEKTGELDMIFIVGDLFDGPLSHYSDEAVKIQLWLFDFLKMCATRNIMVRILEGTPSHDWKQTIWAEVVKAIGQLNVDLKYVQHLDIEYIEKFDLNILYVPDEWRPETDQTWMEVNQLLTARGLKQVDFTLLHGAFSEQLPDHVTAPTHVSERYASITKRHVFVGHVHKAWSHLNLLGNGSFDRLAHGEEEKKGYWEVTYTDHQTKVVFVENTNAMQYKTIACTGLSTEQALEKIERSVVSLPAGSHVRIEAKMDDPIISSLEVLRKKYPHLLWSSKKADKKTLQSNLMLDHRPKSKAVPITQDNVRQLLMEKVLTTKLPVDVIVQCESNLTALGIP